MSEDLHRNKSKKNKKRSKHSRVSTDDNNNTYVTVNLDQSQVKEDIELPQEINKCLLPMSVIETSTNGRITSFLLSEYNKSSCFAGGHIVRNIEQTDNPFMAFMLAKKAAYMFDSRIGISTVENPVVKCGYICLYDSNYNSNKIFTVCNTPAENIPLRVKTIYEDYCNKIAK